LDAERPSGQVQLRGQSSRLSTVRPAGYNYGSSTAPNRSCESGAHGESV